MKPGDFFLLHEGDPESRIIQFTTDSHWNHAGLITDVDGGTLEALNTGVTADTLTRFAEGSYVVIDTELTDDQRAACVIAARACVGDGYDWLDLLGIGADMLTHAKIVVGTASHFICSAFVAQELAQVGAVMPPAYDVRLMSPGALAAWWKVDPK